MLRRFTCFYQVLKVNAKATKCEIRSSYLELAKSNHPDQSGDKEIFQTIKNAYEVLTDDEKRFDYDLEKGYLNAADIDEMEMNLKIYGSRYVGQEVKLKIEEIGLDSGKKKKVEEAETLSPMFYLRFKFFLCLSLGFPVTYSASIYFIENYVYPTAL